MKTTKDLRIEKDTIDVYKTDNYDLFKNVRGNRPVRRNRVKKIVFISGKTKTGNLLRKALAKYFMVIEPDLSDISITAEVGKRTIIKSGDVDISDADCMMFRSTKSHPDIIYAMAVALEANGCYIVDGIDRLRRYIGNKASSSMERSWHHGGINTFIPSTDKKPPWPFPLIVKPIDGKFCRGVRVCNNMSDYKKAYVENNGHVIVQEYVEFKYENRVLVINVIENEGTPKPEIVYIASKRNVARKGTRKKASDVTRVQRLSLSSFVKNNPYVMNRKGVIGYDIGTDVDGKHYIIEANYSPRFDRATKKLGVDVADKITNILYNT